MTIKVECVVDLGAALGESAIWSVKDQALYWTDIVKGELHRHDPVSGDNHRWGFGRPLGCFALKRSGGAILALTDGFHDFDFETEAERLIAHPEPGRPENRFNDGAVDPAGRFLAGTMPIAGASAAAGPQGALYALEADQSTRLIMDGFFTVNGLAFSPDGRTAYVSDSFPARRTIWAYDYDVDDGCWSNKRVFFDTSSIAGRPDGGAVDADGCYWMAGVGGWQIVRLTPAGVVDRIIDMPVEKPTRIAFGGARLDTLFVTSIGAAEITPGTEAQQPQAGGVFALQVPGVTGIPFHDYAG